MGSFRDPNRVHWPLSTRRKMGVPVHFHFNTKLQYRKPTRVTAAWHRRRRPSSLYDRLRSKPQACSMPGQVRRGCAGLGRSRCGSVPSAVISTRSLSLGPSEVYAMFQHIAAPAALFVFAALLRSYGFATPVPVPVQGASVHAWGLRPREGGQLLALSQLFV